MCLLMLLFFFFFVQKSFPQTSGSKRLVLEISELIDNSKYDLASSKIDSLIAIANKNNDQLSLAEAYNLRGTINNEQSKIKEAIYDYSRAIEIYENNKNRNGVAGGYVNLGSIYSALDEYKMALSYYFKAIKIFKETKKNRNLGILYNNIGNIYQKLHQLANSNFYLRESLTEAKQFEDSMLAGMANHNLGINFAESQNYDSAIVYYNKSLQYISTYENGPGHIFNYKQLGDAYYKLKNYKEAEKYFLKALELSNAIGISNSKEDLYAMLSMVYEYNKDYKQALAYNKEYAKMIDSLSSEEIKSGIMKAQFDSELQQQKKIQEQEQKNRDAISKAKIDAQRKIITASLIALAIVLVLVVIVFRSYKQKQKANKIISKQKELVEEKNTEILSSINYARRIQTALLTSDNYLKKYLKDYFILYKPKDIVSGDFYWGLEHKGKFYMVVADCTGHGVPGAFMSLLNISILNELIIEKNISDPGKILTEARNEIIKSLNPEGGEESKDGMDCILCAFDFKANTLHYACANNSFYLLRDNTVILSETNKMSVGKSHDDSVPFKSYTLTVNKGDTFYLITDGYADQFGGPKGKKFKYNQLLTLFVQIQNEEMSVQKNKLNEAFDKWRGDLEQVDDVCIVSIKI